MDGALPVRHHLAVRRLTRTTTAQRVVIIIGLGLVLGVSWLWWYAGEAAGSADWFSYAPNTGTYYVVEHRQVEHLIVPLTLVVLWSAASVWLLGLRRTDPE